MSTTARPVRWALILAAAVECAAVLWGRGEVIASEQPQVQTECDGAPIKRFGFCWVLGEAPDLLDDVTLQVGNTAPRVKVHPKHSGQIKRNFTRLSRRIIPSSFAHLTAWSYSS